MSSWCLCFLLPFFPLCRKLGNIIFPFCLLLCLFCFLFESNLTLRWCHDTFQSQLLSYFGFLYIYVIVVVASLSDHNADLNLGHKGFGYLLVIFSLEQSLWLECNSFKEF